VPAVRAEHGVGAPKRRAGADRDRLLAGAQVRGAAHQVLGEQPLDLLLEEADLDHAAKEVEQLLLGQFTGVRPPLFRCRHSTLSKS
jgi:hypothetical protein